MFIPEMKFPSFLLFVKWKCTLFQFQCSPLSAVPLRCVFIDHLLSLLPFFSVFCLRLKIKTLRYVMFMPLLFSLSTVIAPPPPPGGSRTFFTPCSQEIICCIALVSRFKTCFIFWNLFILGIQVICN